jgi:paraquat-inducible protein A
VSRPVRRVLSRCPRCHAHLYARKPASIARTCAFLVAAYALYVPANVLPIIVTEQFFDRQADTILSGVAYLWATGSWPLALIVFLASIVLPLAKLVALTFLALSVELGLRWRPERRVQLYRLVRSIGRWSMLDIFVAAMLTAAVDLQAIAAVRPGPGAVAFAAVVLLTIFAAQAFDPRLIWDARKDDDG